MIFALTPRLTEGSDGQAHRHHRRPANRQGLARPRRRRSWTTRSTARARSRAPSAARRSQGAGHHPGKFGKPRAGPDRAQALDAASQIGPRPARADHRRTKPDRQTAVALSLINQKGSTRDDESQKLYCNLRRHRPEALRPGPIVRASRKWRDGNIPSNRRRRPRPSPLRCSSSRPTRLRDGEYFRDNGMPQVIGYDDLSNAGCRLPPMSPRCSARRAAKPIRASLLPPQKPAKAGRQV